MRIATSLSLGLTLALSVSVSPNALSHSRTHAHTRTLFQSSSVEGNMKTPTLEKVKKNAGNEKSSSKELKLEFLFSSWSG